MVKKYPFGTGFFGVEASLYQISVEDGSSVAITDYGATVQSILVPDKDGKLRNVVLGHEDSLGYQRGGGFWGATIGRVGNRLGNSEFKLDGVVYKLEKNNGENHLHGGTFGFDKRMWTGKILSQNSVRFTYFSPDGENNYPGNMIVNVTFSFNDAHELAINYEAITDQNTLCNLTNHSYFNLNGTLGRRSGTALNHKLMINADYMTACTPDLLPNGDLLPVNGTPFDFRKPKEIGRDINADNIYLSYPHGYDHNFCLNGEGYRKVAQAEGDESGIVMEVWTDLPGMQFFSSNGNSFCLETQCYPNANQHPEFPSIVLKKGDIYAHQTAYCFK